MSGHHGTVFYDGDLRTLDPQVPRARHVSALDGKIVYVGDSIEDAEGAVCGALGDQSFKDSIKKIALLGRQAIPGLVDSHAHALAEGLRLTQLDLAGLSYEALLEKVSERAKTLPEGAWLHGRGWDQNSWPGSAWPGTKDLDLAAPRNPVALDRVDKHSVWLNSRALALAGIDKFTPAPTGGEILKNDDGSLKGVLVGQAMRRAWAAMPAFDGYGRDALFISAQSEMLSLGLTTLMDCGTRVGDYRMLEGLNSSGGLKIRFRGFAIGDPWEGDLLDAQKSSQNSPMLAVDGVKLFSDGSLGSRSAWLREPYSDQPDHFGDHNFEDGALLRLFQRARDKNLQVAIHAIGDRAISQAVDLMEKALGSESRERHFRLEHFQVTDKEILKKTAALGLIPSIQSVGLMYDLHMAPLRLGPARVRDSYAWRRILDGGTLINGSDAPIESPNPFFGIYAAVSRRDLSGRPEEGFQVGDALTLEEALLSYTQWAADAAFLGDSLGSLSTGKFLDMAVVDRDIFSVGAREIADTKALMTIVAGEPAYVDPSFYPGGEG
jgi:predicted amidohydrolase YtcJ